MIESDRESQEITQGKLYAVLSEVSVRIGSMSDSHQVMECIGTAVREVGLNCAFALFGPGDDYMTVRYVSMDTEVLPLTEMLSGLGPNGRPILTVQGPLDALQENNPIFAPDLVEFAQAVLPNVSKAVIQHALQVYGMAPASQLVCLPLPIVDHLMGMMTLVGPGLTRKDLPMLSLFGHVVTCAIKGAQGRGLLQDVIDAQGEGIGVVDRDECFLFANPAAEAVFGVASGTLVGRCLMDFVAPENQMLVLEQTQKRRHGLENSYELEIVRPDGERRHLLVTAAPRTDRQGLYLGAYGVFRDDTERFDQESELLGAYSELEEQVAARTAELLDLNRHLGREVAERQRRAEELVVLNTLSRLMSASLSLDQVIDACLDGIMEAMAPDLAMMYLCEGNRLVPQRVRARDPGLAYYEPGAHHIGHCLCGLAMGEKRPFYSSDIHKDPLCTLNECKSAGLCSVAALPLVIGEQVLGVLTMASLSSHDYARQDTFWEALRGQIAIAVHNAHLHRQLQEHVDELEREVCKHAQTEMYLQERNQELALLSRSIHALSSALDTEHVMESIIDQVHFVLGVVACSVWLLDTEENVLVCEQAAGYGENEVLGWRLPVDVGIVGAAIQTGETVHVLDTRDDRRHYRGIDEQTGIESRSALAVPLLARGKAVGVLEVVDDVPNRFSPADKTLVELMALSAANALENARVYEALQASQRGLERRNQDLVVLNAISNIVGRPGNLEQVLTESLDTMLAMTAVDAGWIGLFGRDHSSLSLVIDRGLGPHMIDQLKEAGAHTDTNKATILAGESIVITVSPVGPDSHDATSERPAVATLVGVPIRAREERLGVLGSMLYRTSDVDEQDVQLLLAIGNQLGATVESARLLEQSAEIEVLRSLDDMRSELIATASHELRTPLGLIRLFATALLMEEVTLDAETSQEFLSGIADETEKLEHIVNDLLDLSRMEGGQLLLDRRPVDLGQLARETIAQMAIELEGRTTLVHLDEEPLIANLDPIRIEQVLRNVLNNAVKYSAEGSEIAIRSWRVGETIVLSVIDGGIGIPAEEQERIFERFYRVDNELTRRTRGAGLGLSICKWIVEAHGGSIQVTSELGRGSEFRIALPAEIGA